MENRELVYKLAEKLSMIIEVWRKGKYIGKFKFVDGKLYKLKE